MTMLSFRVDDRDAREIQSWAERLGVDRSELLREALRRHRQRLKSERDAETWLRSPLSAAEQPLTEIEEWGPAEDWVDAAR